MRQPQRPIIQQFNIIDALQRIVTALQGYDYVVRFSDCNTNGHRYDNYHYVKCVK